VELYVAYKDYNWMMDLVEEMVERVALDLHGKTEVQVGENVINFARPWKRFTMFEAIGHYTGIDISEMDEAGLRGVCSQLGIEVDPSMGKGKLIDEIFGATCEGKLIQPTFITDYPVEMSPLAKKHRSKPGLVERFEAICNGKEMCNAFSELNDPHRPAQTLRGTTGTGQARRRGGHGARRGLPAFAGIRHAAHGRPGHRHRPPHDDHDQPAVHPGRAVLPADAPRKTQRRPYSRATGKSRVLAEWVTVLVQRIFKAASDLKAANPYKLFNDLAYAEEP
jgi:hypothetical protein